MAMTRLCANLTEGRNPEQNVRRFKFHAFIVDHGVRPKSHKEAMWVQRQIMSWGIPFNSILAHRWLTQARNKCRDFEDHMASRWRCSAFIELRDRGAKITLSGFG